MFTRIAFVMLFLFGTMVFSLAQDIEPIPLPFAGRSPDSVADESNTFVHLSLGAGVGNVYGTSTRLDDPLVNANPDVALFATRNLDAGGNNNNSPVAVEYKFGSWFITNQNGSVFPLNIGYNVSAHGFGRNLLRHVATAENINVNITYIDHPMLNNNPGAIIMAMPVLGNGSPINNNHIGVYYSNVEQKWSVFNQSAFVPMPVGATFNIYVAPPSTNLAFTHTTTDLNTLDGATAIDNSYLNGNPEALIHVVPNWNTGVYVNHPFGIAYGGGRWNIIQTNGQNMPIGASFNVFVISEFNQGDGILVNGGFEVSAPGQRAVPTSWNTLNAGVNSKRVCNKYTPTIRIRSYAGECAYALRGNPAGRVRIAQTISYVTPAPNNVINLRAAVSATNVANARIRARLFLSDGTRLNLDLAGAVIDGTYDYKEINTSVVLPSAEVDVVRVKLQISINNSPGTLFIDQLRIGLTQ